MSDALRAVLEDLANARPLAVAVSGGVDSLTLMAFAHDVAPGRVRAFHAVSPAVPPASTARVEALARAQGWTLTLLDAGETADPAYLANPVDRCRVCKSHLYDALGAATDAAGPAQVLSGTNTDDLDDYRPGLEAARARGVRHPFVDARMDKAAVRALARALGMGDVAALPAQPCLASRIETGIAIRPPLLALVNEVEDLVRARLGDGVTVRCRVRAAGVVIELDAELHHDIDDPQLEALGAAARERVRAAGIEGGVRFAPYRMGSAFLRVL
jgi:pyridinium-3,5-biscarboxylic acid mononucleotide sulfurtransferase